MTELRVQATGVMCPVPIIELAKRITDVEVGGVVVLVADDPAAAADVPAWCRMRGHDYLGERADADGATSYLVRRTH